MSIEQTPCGRINAQFEDQIREIVAAQRDEVREAIFFIYEDGRTTEVFKGESTSISLTRDEEQRILRQGNIVASVHTHPSGFDPSTVDVITGLMTNQDSMCVATPTPETEGGDYVLTCVDLSRLDSLEKRRLFMAMRRSSVSITELGRQLRKQHSFQRFDISICRSEQVKMEGTQFPVTGRPSAFEFIIGSSDSVQPIVDDK